MCYCIATKNLWLYVDHFCVQWRLWGCTVRWWLFLLLCRELKYCFVFPPNCTARTTIMIALFISGLSSWYNCGWYFMKSLNWMMIFIDVLAWCTFIKETWLDKIDKRLENDNVNVKYKRQMVCYSDINTPQAIEISPRVKFFVFVFVFSCVSKNYLTARC